MAEFNDLTAEWAQVLDGTLAYLRAQAAAELDYAAVVRIERQSWRRAQAMVADVEGEAPPETDELLRQATDVSTVRQAVTEQVSPVDDGPEGMADEANRELSEEIGDEPLSDVDTAEEVIDDADTAPPGTHTPMPSARQAAEEPNTLETEFDLDEIDEIDEIEEIPETESELVDLDDELIEEEPAPAANAGPLLPDFDFADDEDEQDETVVFALGDTGGSTGEAVARLIEEHEAAKAAEASAALDFEEESFDLMPDLELDEPEAELEFEDDDFELDPLPIDDDTDMGQDAARPQARAAAGASARVTAGLYGNPNVPTIRDTPQPAPRAAAIQINAAKGTGKMMGFEEEEEPLAIGAVEDYDEDYEEDGEGAVGGGFSLSIQEYDEEEEWEDEDSEEEVAATAPAPVYQGPDLSHVAGVLAQAQDAAEQGDMQTGVQLFSDVLDADPDRIEAYVGRGRLYLDLGDYSRAMSDFMTAEELAPSNPEPQVAIGDLYFARKDYRKAIDYFDGALSMDPNHAMAHCRRGISFYYRKKYSEALADLKTAESLDGDIPNIGTYISMAKKKAKK